MRLKVLGSSSAGNCYILENADEALVIECGVAIKELKVSMDFDFSKVVGALISHEHGDHAKGAKDVAAAGIPIYSSPGTAKAIGIDNHHCFHKITIGIPFKVGNFKILPFETNHDAAQPCCFYIYHPETGNILFLTDTFYCAYTFKDLHQVIIEANYCQMIIDKKVADGEGHQFLRDRILKSHMSLANCKEMLKANDLRNVRNIVLIHLSDSNSDATRFRNEVAAVTGKVVHVADKGMIIENFDNKIF